MSAIDQYQTKLRGFIECPSEEDFVLYNPTRKIAIYELLENIPPAEKDFDGKKGDIIVGGGSGEAPAMRISLPEAFEFFNQTASPALHDKENLNLWKTFWSEHQTAILRQGFAKTGWTPDIDLAEWVAAKVCRMLKAGSASELPMYKLYFQDTLIGTITPDSSDFPSFSGNIRYEALIENKHLRDYREYSKTLASLMDTEPDEVWEKYIEENESAYSDLIDSDDWYLMDDMTNIKKYIQIPNFTNDDTIDWRLHPSK